MSRQLEQYDEEKRSKRNRLIIEAVEYGLANAIQRAGAEYTGFAYKSSPGGGLMVIKGILAGKSQVAFVGAEDLGSTLIKAVREAKSDRLRWKVDKYGG